ncbi:glycosyltransferase [Thiomicrorhabdus sp.]|uniref:glycosyltransferase n=1 Tax=Thiomicrorhabdus sp. TaxID=2039724 RepID=UPI0029C74DD6|nr:glycosyltransferase [Thiomicrorhabdus sp.]
MKILFVVDWLDKFAGAERVVASLVKEFPPDKVKTLVNIMSHDDLKKMFGEHQVEVESSGLQKMGRYFRYFFPFFYFFVKDLEEKRHYELIISSSHAVAKGVKVPLGSLHISYFQARNMKYIWEEGGVYFKSLKHFLSPIFWYLKKLDVRAAQNPNYIISNSKFVQEWVKKTYGRDSKLIYPPVNTEAFSLGSHKGQYFVTIGRLAPYKRFDIVIKAFNQLGYPLKVIGDGSQRKGLELMSESNIEFLGYLETSEINQCLQDAKAFVYAGIEDFGIAPVEAQATGCPCICLDQAGTAETVIDGRTGILFKNQCAEELVAAVKMFLENESAFDYSEIQEHSGKFSEQRFLNEMKTYIDSRKRDIKK